MPKIIVFSGAGISAPSGIRTFRGDGLWEEHDIDKVCNDFTWKSNYSLVHTFYNDRRTSLANVVPNRAHEAVAGWQRDFKTLNVTQNVDDLFERAGCSETIHVHGYLPEMQCVACGNIWDIGYKAWDINTDRCERIRGTTVCGCRKGIKPHVVFFGGDAPRYADMYRIFEEIEKDDIVVVSGTSGVVMNFESHLMDKPGFKIYNNLVLPEFGDSIYDVKLLESADTAFPKIDALIRERLG